MPNRDVHGKARAVVGGGYAVYRAWGQPAPHVLIETAGGVLAERSEGFFPTGSMRRPVLDIGHKHTAWRLPGRSVTT
jgi:hypothetical protein